jgi:hypothetical protein
MATKTFKIGECARGGVITVNVTPKEIDVITKEWDFSAGSNRGSNQSNAEELYRKTFNTASRHTERDLEDYLANESTSYYAGEIVKWVKTKIDFKQDDWW